MKGTETELRTRAIYLETTLHQLRGEAEETNREVDWAKVKQAKRNLQEVEQAIDEAASEPVYRAG